MSLAARSVRSAAWTSLTTFFSLPITFVQTVLLARLLPVEFFGLFAGTNSLLILVSTVFEFGFTNAFIHRTTETEDETHASHVFFTLRLLFETVSAITMVIFGCIAFSGMRRQALLILVIAMFIYRLTQIPRILLIRRVEHRRLAVIDFGVALASAAVSLYIAYTAHSIYALFVSTILVIVFGIIGFYLYRPFWKPRLVWDPAVMRYFLSFGGRNLLNNLLESALENADNLWTSFFLGDLLLGYYSRAFKFAIYPRLVLSNPLNTIAVGTYAELKYDRHRLSRAFFQINALLVRSGFLLAGWLAVIAPYFIRLLLGERWLPMLSAFRLMLLFTMLDPIKVTVSSILMAVGFPEKISRIRITQLVVLVAGLFLLGFRFQIAGVALAVNLMMIVGMGLSFYDVRRYVDFSLRRLFIAPVVALAAALICTYAIDWLRLLPPSDWFQAAAKTLLFGLAYGGVLILLEGRALFENLGEILKLVSLPGKVADFLRLRTEQL